MKNSYTPLQLEQAHALLGNSCTAEDLAKSLYLAHLGGICDAADFLDRQSVAADDEAEAYWENGDPTRAFTGRAIASTCRAMGKRLVELVDQLNPFSSTPSSAAPTTPPTPVDRNLS